MKPAIHNRGRGPEIVGSRITVYDVLAETRAGRPVEQLTREWKLSVEQIECALRYIDEHREEVERDWAAIQEWHRKARAESEARVAALRANRKPSNPELWERFQRARAAAREARHEGHSGRCEPPGPNGTGAPRIGESAVE
jgi:uncharacterized protein (DUF433 family)